MENTVVNSGLRYQLVRGSGANGLHDSDLTQLKKIFASLDDLSASVCERNELLTEASNVLADLLRGIVSTLHGIDVRPFSELGPHDGVDLKHSLGVLSRIITEAQQVAQSDCCEMRETHSRQVGAWTTLTDGMSAAEGRIQDVGLTAASANLAEPLSSGQKTLDSERATIKPNGVWPDGCSSVQVAPGS